MLTVSSHRGRTTSLYAVTVASEIIANRTVTNVSLKNIMPNRPSVPRIIILEEAKEVAKAKEAEGGQRTWQMPMLIIAMLPHTTQFLVDSRIAAKQLSTDIFNE